MTGKSAAGTTVGRGASTPPSFFTMKVFCSLSVPWGTGPKSPLTGVTVRATPLMPVPVSSARLVAVPDRNSMAAVLAPALVGANCTETLQLPPRVMAMVQVFEPSRNCDTSVPTRAALTEFSVAVAVLVMVNSTPWLVCPTVTFMKLWLAGLNMTAAAGAPPSVVGLAPAAAAARGQRQTEQTDDGGRSEAAARG